MAVMTYTMIGDGTTVGGSRTTFRYFLADTLAERPATGLNEGDLAYTKDNDTLYVALTATTWKTIG